MNVHECYQEENIGKFKEFINNFKCMKTILSAIVIAIFAQVGTFLFLWGALTNTVSKNSDYLWGDMTVSVRENTRTLDRLMSKLETVQMIAVQNPQITQNGRIHERGNHL